MQSVPITTKVVSWNPVYGEVYSMQQEKENIYIYIEKHGGKQPTNFEDNTTKNIHEITGSNRQKQISPSILLKWDIQSNLSYVTFQGNS